MYRKFVSISLLLSFLLYIAGCTTTRYLSRDNISEVEKKSNAWVRMNDGTQFEIKEPKIQGSKLVGYVEEEGYKEIDFSQIESLEIKEGDEKKTTILGAVAVASAFILVWVLSSGGSESGSCGS